MTSCVDLNSSQIYDNNMFQFGGQDDECSWLPWIFCIIFLCIAISCGAALYRAYFPPVAATTVPATTVPATVTPTVTA